MNPLDRCRLCGHRLWFSRSGHYVGPGGIVYRWHARHIVQRTGRPPYVIEIKVTDE